MPLDDAADATPSPPPLAAGDGAEPLVTTEVPPDAPPDPEPLLALPPPLPAPLPPFPEPLLALPPPLPAPLPPFPEPLGPPLSFPAPGPVPVLLHAPSPAPSTLLPAVAKPPASVAFLVLVTVASLVADLVTKGWAKSHLSGFDPSKHGPRHLEIWKGHIEFIFAQNPGGAWSFLRNLPDSLRRPFFLVVSAGAIVFIITIYQRVNRDQWAMKLGLPLALGGAAGNLVDRIRYGWVVDFIDFSMKWGGREHHWPTFNVADIAIVFGVGLMAIDMLRSRGLHPHDHATAMSPLSGQG